MPSLPRRFFSYSSLYRCIMPASMLQPRALAASVSVVPTEGLVAVSGKGKLVELFLSEKRLVAVGRATLGNGWCNAGGEQLQRRSKHAESPVKRWDGVKDGFEGKGFGRSGFWFRCGAGVDLCRGLSTSRIVAKSLGEIVNVAAGVEELEDSVPLVDQVSFCEDRIDCTAAASLEGVSSHAGGNGESDLSVDRETNATVAEVDPAGNA